MPISWGEPARETSKGRQRKPAKETEHGSDLSHGLGFGRSRAGAAEQLDDYETPASSAATKHKGKRNGASAGSHRSATTIHLILFTHSQSRHPSGMHVFARCTFVPGRGWGRGARLVTQMQPGSQKAPRGHDAARGHGR